MLCVCFLLVGNDLYIFKNCSADNITLEDHLAQNMANSLR